MRRKEFERDIINRQRNIVFPDTVLNEGRFYRTLFSWETEYTTTQRICLGLLGAFLTAMGSLWLAAMVGESKHGFNLFILYLLVIAVGVVGMGVMLILRGLMPPQPTRLKRLQTARRPRRHRRP